MTTHHDHDHDVLGMSAATVDDHVVIRLWGVLDVASRTRAYAFLDAEVHVDAQRVVMDLSGVTFADSSGLAVLFHALRLVEARGGELVLRSPPPDLRRLLQLVGLDETFPLEDPTVPLRTAPWPLDARGEQSIIRPRLGSARRGGRAPTG